MAPLRCAAKFDPFLSLDCAPTPSTLAQSKERKGPNFATWQPWGGRHRRRHQRGGVRLLWQAGGARGGRHEKLCVSAIGFSFKNSYNDNDKQIRSCNMLFVSILEVIQELESIQELVIFLTFYRNWWFGFQFLKKTEPKHLRRVMILGLELLPELNFSHGYDSDSKPSKNAGIVTPLCTQYPNICSSFWSTIARKSCQK